jgi:hypothetical protein
VIAHVVLFTPLSSLGPADRQGVIEALEAACRDIPQIRRARVGRRRVLGYNYDEASPTSYEFALVLEFDSLEDLDAYLRHPSHTALGRLFHTSTERALAHDFEIVDATDTGAVTRLAGID